MKYPFVLASLCWMTLPVFAAGEGDRKDCAANTNPDQKIEICTRIIEDGSESPGNRAIAYNNRGLAYQKVLAA